MLLGLHLCQDLRPSIANQCLIDFLIDIAAHIHEDFVALGKNLIAGKCNEIDIEAPPDNKWLTLNTCALGFHGCQSREANLLLARIHGNSER